MYSKMINSLNEVKIYGAVIEDLSKKRKNSKSYLLFFEAFLVEDDSSHLIIDSGETNHVCSFVQMLRSSRQLAKGAFTPRVGTGTVVSVVAVGITNLDF